MASTIASFTKSSNVFLFFKFLFCFFSSFFPKIFNANDKVFLLTNSSTYKYVNVDNWSRNDLINYGNLLGVTFTFDGYGYAFNSNIKGKDVVKGETINITLKTKYNEEITTEEEKTT